MKFVAGMIVGAMLSVGGVALYAQNERAMHPRIVAAIRSLKDANAYMAAAPHDFGGHRVDAMHADEEAIKQLNFALAYRGKMDRR